MEPVTRPTSPESLRDCLAEVVPTFLRDWTDDDPRDDDDPVTFHRVMREFTYFFGKAASSLSAVHLPRLGALVNASVEVADDLENAVATCFLEHLHQVHALKALWPYLSPRARAECHA